MPLDARTCRGPGTRRGTFYRWRGNSCGRRDVTGLAADPAPDLRRGPVEKRIIDLRGSVFERFIVGRRRRATEYARGNRRRNRAAGDFYRFPNETPFRERFARRRLLRRNVFALGPQTLRYTIVSFFFPLPRTLVFVAL